MLSANLFFYFFSGVLVFSAMMVIIASHPVFSLLFLVLSFIATAFILFLLECEFIALIFIIIYVGAIAVLFLFAIMMLDAKLQNLARNLLKYLPVGFLFAFGFVGPILLQTLKKPLFDNSLEVKNYYLNWFKLTDTTSNIETYGQILYTYFVFQFLIVGLILLAVLLGVVYLTNANISSKTVDQTTYKQISVSSRFFY